MSMQIARSHYGPTTTETLEAGRRFEKSSNSMGKIPEQVTKPDQSFPLLRKGCCKIHGGKIWLSLSKRPTKRKIILTLPLPQSGQQLPTNPTEHKSRIKQMEDQTLNQRLYQLVAPHPSPYLSPSCKHGTILPPPQGSARCQLPHQVKSWKFSSRSICRSLWLTNLLTATPSLAKPLCGLEHLVRHITQRHCKRRVSHATSLQAGSAKKIFFLGTVHADENTVLWALLANVKALHDMPPCIKKMAVKHSSQRISTAKETTWCGCGFVGRSA